MRLVKLYKIFLFSSFLVSSSIYAGHSKVLIINSDNSIHKYSQIAKEFKSVLQKNTYNFTEFDLEKHLNNSENDFKQIIEKENPNIIFCIGTKAYLLAKNFSKDRKLLFSAIINWRRLNIGEQTYGVENELSPVQEMSLLKYFFPSAKKIGILYNDEFSDEYIEAIKTAAGSLGIEILLKQIDNEQEIVTALNQLLPQIDIFWIISDPIVLASESSVRQIFELSKLYKKPVYAYSNVFIKQGAILTISADIDTIGRQSASLVLQIDGNKVPDGTVQIPAGSEVTLNKCTVDLLRINFNQDALDSVNNIVNCDKP